MTTAALLDAAVAHDVRRFVYASSNHAVGRTPRTDLVTTETRPRPDTFYGVGKVASEALLSLYTDRYGIDTLACRIGSFRHEPASVRQLSTWLSHDDCVRMVDACLTTPAPGFAVLYGISANTRAWWDLEPGRALGYRPMDDAEEFADRIAGLGRRRRRGRARGRAVHVGVVLPPSAGSARRSLSPAMQPSIIRWWFQRSSGRTTYDATASAPLTTTCCSKSIRVPPGSGASSHRTEPSRSPDTSTSSTDPSRDTACSTRSRVYGSVERQSTRASSGPSFATARICGHHSG